MGIIYLCFGGASADHPIHKVSPGFAVIMWLLWGAGVLVGTFDAPFTAMCDDAANGYISIWIGFIASSTYLYTSFDVCAGA